MIKNTLYGPIEEKLFKQLSHIKLLICDIDGVFSDGRIYLGNQGEELKAFHTRDGFGIKAIINAGIQVAVITGRKSNIVEKRMHSLGIQHIYQGQENKVSAYNELKQACQLEDQNIAYIGDDMPDYSVMQQVGLAIAVADAHPIINRISQYTTETRGGFGAVREICDLLLESRGQLLQAQGMSV
ncbi:3-deoxy-manno-octulosonate-8-phosphatase KdsC [Gayadomonas joobiniege]|uniref:3-deoxy-manno-octulosonate-8-phosphatase KdsC n=1 Tax=Gayadomonas joobiniege TaxID=1234606 RepID=UPI000377397D|nr:3-deoxy-manno-octulosonate-8-phosphatase KdsC [Gayadomonas joobiniege]